MLDVTSKKRKRTSRVTSMRSCREASRDHDTLAPSAQEIAVCPVMARDRLPRHSKADVRSLAEHGLVIAATIHPSRDGNMNSTPMEITRLIFLFF